jgi:hypothetical protein
MRIGVPIRNDQRGLSVQTQAFARHIHADRLLVHVPGPSDATFPTTPIDGVPMVTVGTGWRLPEVPVRRWLDGLDFILGAESFYDDRFADWAREAGATTALMVNPEFVPPQGGWGIGSPDLWWSATSWRLDHLPPQAEVVPMPVELPSDGWEHPRPEGSARLLHLAGKRAVGDRNGTDALLAALPLLREPCHVTVAC